METNNDQAKSIATDTEEKMSDSEAPVSEVTTSDESQVTAGGDAPVTPQGESSKVAEEKDNIATSDQQQDEESTVTEESNDDKEPSDTVEEDSASDEALQGDTGDEPSIGVAPEPVEETEAEKSAESSEDVVKDSEEKSQEGSEEASQDVKTKEFYSGDCVAMPGDSQDTPGDDVDTPGDSEDTPGDGVDTPIDEGAEENPEAASEEEEKSDEVGQNDGQEKEDEEKGQKEEEQEDEEKGQKEEEQGDEMRQEEEKEQDEEIQKEKEQDEEIQKEKEDKGQEDTKEEDDGENDEVKLLSEVDEETSKPSEEEDDGKNDGVDLLSEVEETSKPSTDPPTVEGERDVPVEDETKDPEESKPAEGTKEVVGDEDALLKDDKDVGEDETGQIITAAEEDALLKDTEEDKMEEEEEMEVEQVEEKGDDDVESMEVDEEPKDVEMRSEPGSVAAQEEEKDVQMESESDAKVDEEAQGEVTKETVEKEAESDVGEISKQQSTESDKDKETVAKTSDATSGEAKGDTKDDAAEKSDDVEIIDDETDKTMDPESAKKQDETVDDTSKEKETPEAETASEEKITSESETTSEKETTPKTATETESATESSKDTEANSTQEEASEEKTTSEADKDGKADNSSDVAAVVEDGDSGSGSQDTSKSPVTVAGTGEKKAVKKGKVGFSLGNIVSQLKKKAEKDEVVQEGDVPEKDVETISTAETSDAADATKSSSSPTKDTPPAGSSRRKQHKTTAQHITKDKDKDDNDDDDDIVEIVEEKTNENEGQMKNYATDTMNELLGMFGFDKVDQQETQGLKLGEKFSANVQPGAAPKPGTTGAVEVRKVKTPIVGKETKVPEKKIHCTECKQPITSKTNLGWGSQPFCSPNCLTNFQNRQTSVCEYCNGLISQASRGKHTKEMQMGQRKEFCSQGCVTEYTKRLKTCAHCAKEVKAADLIVAPVGAQNKFKEFCNQGCVDAYEKKRQAHSNSSKGNTHPCAVCSKSAKVKHEINFQNVIHRLCSNDCFNKFRTKHSLALNFCEQCGVICYNENLVPNVFLDGKMKRFCSQRCLGEYKVKNRRQVPCFNCKKSNTNHNMIEEAGPTGDIRLFCTMPCLQSARSKPPAPTQAPVTRTATKAATKAQSTGLQSVTQSAPCDHCRKNQRPLYHLTMSDNTIRNFCSYPCVIAFQAQFNVPPVTLPQETLMLKCAFCSTGFIHKPLTLEYKGSISLFCTQGCFDEFKRANSVVVQCDYCHLEKILHDRSFFSGMAKSFCSEGCKLLFKQQFAQRLGLKCIVCDYCAQTCRSTVEMVYNKTRRRFCGIACRDKYDKWFNKTARCDGCKLMGRTLSETFMWRDEIKKVCDQKCLLLFYTQQNLPNMTTQGQVQIQGGTQQPVAKTTKTQPGQREYNPKQRGVLQQKQASSGTPVIANVMSLASLQQQSPITKTVVRAPLPVAKATKQTQITTAPPKIKPPPPPPAPLPPAPKMVRNKITLCKPFTQTKSVSCRPVHQHKSCQTDGPRHPIIIPIPVPIYIPVPMQMYTTPVPFPVGINMPIPVPMFIPVAAANADKLIKTIKEIKDKTPSDPLEAELLMMADAIAGDDPPCDDNQSTSAAADEDSSTTQGETQNLQDGEEPKEGEPDDTTSITMEEAEDVIPSDILAENILQMAAEMTNVLGEDQDLTEDIASLLAPDIPPTPQKPKTRRPKRRSKGGRNKRYMVDSDEETQQPGQSAPAITKSKEDAKKSVGINAFRYFIDGKINSMSEKEKKRNKMLRPNVLECATEELYFGLCMFIKEARQPNGERFLPDMLLLIFLSIQRELFDNERPENIFTDYEQFTQLVHKEVKDWKPMMDPTTDLVTNSLVDEESLWNSKQLGAHSPYILLSTLLYFNTKCFRLNGVEQHKELAFVRVQKHLRKTESGRSMYLRYFPKEMMKKIQGTEGGKRKRERDDSLDLPEQCENTDNPLRCPVKLYEFYLSKCPESVKTRTDLFYLVPERSCIPDSPVWYTCQPLLDKDMNHILSRIMLTKDIHETWAVAASRSEEEYFSD